MRVHINKRCTLSSKMIGDVSYEYQCRRVQPCILFPFWQAISVRSPGPASDSQVSLSMMIHLVSEPGNAVQRVSLEEGLFFIFASRLGRRMMAIQVVEPLMPVWYLFMVAQQARMPILRKTFFSDDKTFKTSWLIFTHKMRMHATYLFIFQFEHHTGSGKVEEKESLHHSQ